MTQYESLKMLVEIIAQEEGYPHLWYQLQGDVNVANAIPVNELVFQQWSTFTRGAILGHPVGWGLDNQAQSLCTLENAKRVGRCVARLQEAWLVGEIQSGGKNIHRTQNGEWEELEEEVETTA